MELMHSGRDEDSFERPERQRYRRVTNCCESQLKDEEHRVCAEDGLNGKVWLYRRPPSAQQQPSSRCGDGPIDEVLDGMYSRRREWRHLWSRVVYGVKSPECWNLVVKPMSHEQPEVESHERRERGNHHRDGSIVGEES